MSIEIAAYYEKTISFDGARIPIGEDAPPLAAEGMLAVADGLGGSAHIRVTGMDRALFDPERVAECLFSRIFPDSHRFPGEFSWADGPFKDYVTDAFSSLALPELKEAYAEYEAYERRRSGEDPEPVLRKLKTTAYFGSRLALALMLGWIRQLSASPREMDILFSKAGTEDGQIYYRDVLCRYLLRNMDMALKSGKVRLFEYEARKRSYFGTTLTAAIVRESEEEIEAVIFGTGDSRICVWDEKGFRQAMDDLGKAGGMISNLQLNDRDTVQILCGYRRYKKPCALFAMSDGFYGMFKGRNFDSSPLFMETYLMDSLANREAADPDSWRKNVEAFMSQWGKHDDSNSLAAGFYGFSSFAEVKEAAERRLKDLEVYDEGLPEDYLTVNYGAKAEKARKDRLSGMKELLDRAFALPSAEGALRAYAKEDPESGWQALRESEEEKRTALREEEKEWQDAVREAVADNFFDFMDRDAANSRGILPFGDSVLRCRKLSEQVKEYLSGREKEYESLRMKVGDFGRGFSLECDEAVSTDRFAAFDEAKGAWVARVRDLEQQCRLMERGMADSMRVIRNHENRIIEARTAFTQANRRLFKERAEEGEKIIARMREEALQSRSFRAELTFPGEKERIRRILDELSALRERKEELEKELKAQEDAFFLSYREKKEGEILSRLLSDPQSLPEDPGLKEEIRQSMENSEELRETERIAARQKESLGRYLEQYMSELTDRKRQDMERYGWL